MEGSGYLLMAAKQTKKPQLTLHELYCAGTPCDDMRMESADDSGMKLVSIYKPYDV